MPSDKSQITLDEQAICLQIMNWMKEGETHYDQYPQINQPNKAHPSTLKGYIQIIGWVRRDLRVCLDKAKARIMELEAD